MSIAELKEKREQLIAVINTMPVDKLSSVEAFINDINNEVDSFSIDAIYDKAVANYRETLQKLAQ